MMRGAPANRPGQYTQDMGRKAYVFDLEVPIFDGMEGVTYPEDYEDLLFLLTDDSEGGAYEYIDGVLGAYDVRISEWSVQDNAQARDGGLFTITLEENSTDPASLRFTLQGETAASPGTAANIAADADQELENLGVDDTRMNSAFEEAGVPRAGEERFWPPGNFLETGTGEVFAAIDAVNISASATASKVDRFTARTNALLDLEEMSRPESWSIRVSLIRLADAAQQAFNRRNKQGTQVTTILTTGVIDVYSLAVQQKVPVADVLALNDIPRPLSIPARTLIRIPSL